MKIAIKSKKPLLDDKLGRLINGDVVDVPDHKARFYLERGVAERYETKVVRERPLEVSGTTEQSSASPVALVLPVQTPTVYEDGAKKRGRKPKGE